MRFWKFSSAVLASYLTAVTVASGPADGDAVADPNSAVVKLTTESFQEFIESNPLVLAEFFAPWCGYCKQLAPEFTAAADSLNDSHPGIKLAQVDCTEEEQLCRDYSIKGYPTLKVIRGADSQPEDYAGPRNSDGIVDYMVKASLPSVQVPTSVEALVELLDTQLKPYVLQILPEGSDEEHNTTFSKVADQFRNDLTFISVSAKDLIGSVGEKFKDLASNTKDASYHIVHPDELSPISFADVFSLDSLKDFVKREVVPFFGEINRETYTLYMDSPIPVAYYFYNEDEQKEAVTKFFKKLGKDHRSKLNFVSLDARLFGRQAEMLNMNASVVPLFAIHDVKHNKKYGVDQTEHPNPTVETIEEFVNEYLEGKAKPIVKSEPLPTEEEQAASPVVLLVAHNHQKFLNDNLGKDVFVKYYAPWCGHCKKLAPTWEDLGEIYGSTKEDAEVVIAKIDHSNNDIETLHEIEGYPTLLLYPADGEVDEETGLRKPIVFQNSRDIEALMDFIKENGNLKVDGAQLKAEKDAEKEAEREEAPEEDEDAEHDEL